jgi:predicted ferric reductase
MSLLARGVLSSAIYLGLALAPLVVAALADPIAEPRAFATEAAVGFGFVAFALIAIEFSLVSRLRAAAEPFGTDTLALFHRHMGIAALAFAAAHALLLAPRGAAWRAFDPLSGSAAARTGAIALWSTALLVGSALARRRLRLRYEPWTRSHRALAVVAVGAMLAHGLAVRHYAESRAVAVALVLYVALFLALMARYRWIRPFALSRRPWEVVENRPEGGDTRTLVVRPVGHRGFDFEPGQFVWLVTGRSPRSAQQHPISISSSAEPAADRRIELSIKALGDWSRATVPALARGARVWVDGPFGAFTPDRVPGQGFALIAGGIGVTPMRSILLTLRDRGDPRPVRLFFAARNPARAMFTAELEQLERAMDLRVVYVFEEPEEGWSGERGFVTAEILRRHLPARLDRWQFFVCGPPPMMDSLESILREIGVPSERVHTERFDLV